MSIETVTDNNNASVPPAAAPGAIGISDPAPPVAAPVFLPQVPMDTDMIMNATACLEPKIAFHTGEVVVIECPSPDAFWLGIARDNIMELDDETRAKFEEQEQQAEMAGDEMARLPPELTVPIKWLERIASFENGDDLYRAGRDERVKRTMILCLAHVTATDADLLMSAPQQLFVVTMAERHRLIRFIANGGESVMEDNEDGDVVDGARVASLVSRATVNNTAFFLVKWAGFENAAMTWEPMNLLTQCCPDLVAHFDEAPYKLAIQFPNNQPPNMPVHPLGQDNGAPMPPGTPDMNRPGRGRQSGRGRGRGGKTKTERVPGAPQSVSAPSPVIPGSSSPAPPPVVPAPPVSVVPTVSAPAPVPVPVPVPAPVPIAITTEPQPPFFGTPATLTDTSKGPISLDQLPMALQQQSQRS